MLCNRFTLLLCLSLAVSAAPAHADLRTEMSEDEFRAAGLHKLTVEELQALEHWLQNGPAPTTQTPVPAAPQKQPTAEVITEFGQEQIEKPIAAQVPTEITARLEGEFRGWDGKTVFRLDNGQVWRQRVGGKYRSPKMTDPEVEITKGRYGYYLKILKTGRTVGVNRIQ